MTGSFLSRLRFSACWPFSAVPWLFVGLFVGLLVGACKSPQIPAWMQGSRPATTPPSTLTKAPAKAPAAEPAPPAEVATPAPRETAALAPVLRPPPPYVSEARPQTQPQTQPPPPSPAPALTPTGPPPPSFAPFLERRPPLVPPAQPAALPPAPPAPGAVRVALLVPLSGPNARLGEAMLNAAQMAMFDFADANYELLVHDTRGNPSGAIEAAGLVIADGAQVILGPLLAPSVRAMAPQARAANVPVIAFSSDRSVAGNGIFTMGFFPQAEVERVVDYARSKGILRFAALVPDNDYGAAVLDALRRTAEARGGVVTRVETYDSHAGDYTAVVRRLADYRGRRGTLEAQRARLEARGDEIARRALARLNALETIGGLPFDALLVAGGGKRLQAIAALLPFYDIDPAKVRMLGTGQWDEPGTGAEPALVGGWFAAPPPDARANFVRRFGEIYGRPPPRLATLAYDAAALMAVLARTEGGADFSHQAITAPSGFWGRDGIFRFLPGGIAQRGLAVLQARPKGSKVISKAPESFQALTN